LREVFYVVERVFELVRKLGERAVDAEDLVHGMPALAETGEHPAGALCRQGMHLLQQGEKLLVVDQDGELLLQLFLLTRLRVKALDLGYRISEKVDAPEPLTLVAYELGEALPQGGQ